MSASISHRVDRLEKGSRLDLSPRAVSGALFQLSSAIRAERQGRPCPLPPDVLAEAAEVVTAFVATAEGQRMVAALQKARQAR
jgi:hypothetical protein